ncbi:hypothetical protein DPMN_110689 [Dreissena polymorpha]|uniref:Uncharacterized protein n=1 Tax=Dreissena polymorpha TaxID=45954 RepID=A0A9D4KD22_DREPO|nr:hypothetical protein DPMN_110689 [Dreissena polymorpha]
MICCPCASRPMSDLCADLESNRATPWVCAASSCTCHENNSNSPEVSRFCPEPDYLQSMIPRMVRFNSLIPAATCTVFPVSYIVQTFHVPRVVVVLVEMMVCGLIASI